MGLLDDAIREHLELKRLRGADPAMVARQEHDALGPIHDSADDLDDANAGVSVGVARSTDAGSQTDAADGSANSVQETVEINMEAELSRDSDATGASQVQAANGPHTQPGSGDSLEWEMPGNRLAAPPDASAAGGPEPVSETSNDETADRVEDVLEETPDFLQDTPEQERLWFEQRPPRDFDFNE
jgi:hypothetical protein